MSNKSEYVISGEKRRKLIQRRRHYEFKQRVEGITPERHKIIEEIKSVLREKLPKDEMSRKERMKELDDTTIDNILKSVYNIGTLIEVIMVEFQVYLVDAKFNQKVLNKHAERILKSAQAIQTELEKKAAPIDKEDFEYNHAVEFHRFIIHYLQLPTSAIKEVMDKIDARLKHVAKEKEEGNTNQQLELKL